MELKDGVFVFLLLHPLVIPSTLLGDDPVVALQADNVTEAVSVNRAVDVRQLPQRVYLKLGEIQINRSLRGTLVLHNRTDSHHTVAEIDTDCGCMTAVAGTESFGPGESIHLDFQLDGSNRIAKLRRSLRVFFDQQTLPLVVHLDIQVRGPVELVRTQFELTPRQQTLVIVGKKSISGSIREVVSGRGAFLVDGPTVQDEGTFQVAIVPLQGFGEVSDVVRIHYDTENGSSMQVELPIELRWSSSVRFLPSTVQLRQVGDRWIGQSRMINPPQAEPLNVRELRFVFGRSDGSANSPTKDSTEKDSGAAAVPDRFRAECQLQPLSAVLSRVQITVFGDGKQNMPHFVEIEDRNGSLLGTLHLSTPQGQNNAKN